MVPKVEVKGLLEKSIRPDQNNFVFQVSRLGQIWGKSKKKMPLILM